VLLERAPDSKTPVQVLAMLIVLFAFCLAVRSGGLVRQPVFSRAELADVIVDMGRAQEANLCFLEEVDACDRCSIPQLRVRDGR
jgi:hypothetical protein